MTTTTPRTRSLAPQRTPSTRATSATPASGVADAVPYLPGLDGMRALAVVAVMVYHAHPAWLPGGFLGVEVFFVISGYLITLLLIGEHERHGRVSIGQFWLRRARRLLPALGVLLVGVTVYTALFRRDALGQLRGDVLAALGYVSNWYQIWVGQGYTAPGDFAPLRHLWSLAVEEQFYVLWPLAMVALLRVGRRRLPDLSWALVAIALLITAVMALLVPTGPIGTAGVTPGAYWSIGDRSISKLDLLYLATPTRATGLLLGAAFAMVWRPGALLRGPMRERGALLDAIAVVGLVGLGALCWYLHIVTPDGADPWLFRGGFLATGVATLFVIAAVTHRRSAAGWLLGNAVFVWVGTRSYGLYLYHWPIFQGIRRIAGNTLSLPQFAVAMVATAVVAEASYRFVEMPIRRRAVGTAWRRVQATASDNVRRALAVGAAAVIACIAVAGAGLATAEVRPNDMAVGQLEGEAAVGDPFATPPSSALPTTTVAPTPTAAPAPPVTVAVTTTFAAPTTAPIAVAPPPTAPPTPAPTAAPVTTVPATAAAPPPPPPPPVGDPCAATPIPRYAIGDSVMLGAAAPLAGAGFCVDAVESRAFINGLDQIIRLRAAGRLGPVVVVALGTNGPIGTRDLERLMAELIDVPLVVMVTTHADRSYVPGNNDKLRALPAVHPNVRIIDWANAACPGDCFYDDGIHLKPDGRRSYADEITAVTG